MYIKIIYKFYTQFVGIEILPSVITKIFGFADIWIERPLIKHNTLSSTFSNFVKVSIKVSGDKPASHVKFLRLSAFLTLFALSSMPDVCFSDEPLISRDFCAVVLRKSTNAPKSTLHGICSLPSRKIASSPYTVTISIIVFFASLCTSITSPLLFVLILTIIDWSFPIA